MSNLITDWFMSQVGEWNSQRRYYYPTKGKTLVCKSLLKVEGHLTDYGCDLTLSWDTRGDVESSGSMLISFWQETEVLTRSRGYFTDNQTLSFVSMPSKSVVSTDTEYNGKRYIERTELWDKFRTRQTLGWDTSTNSLNLVGQYYEEKTPLC